MTENCLGWSGGRRQLFQQNKEVGDPPSGDRLKPWESTLACSPAAAHGQPSSDNSSMPLMDQGVN